MSWATPMTVRIHQRWRGGAPEDGSGDTVAVAGVPKDVRDMTKSPEVVKEQEGAVM
jgi:hypothetical protein